MGILHVSYWYLIFRSAYQVVLLSSNRQIAEYFLDLFVPSSRHKSKSLDFVSGVIFVASLTFS